MYRDDPIDDVDLPQLTAAEVERLVDDWLRRLGDLFAGIKAWATANGWTVEEAAVAMLEEPMQRTGVAPRRQPTLTLRSPDGAEVWIKPKALWVIGANGRVDIYSRNGVFTLIDVADSFQPPEWILHRIGKGSGRRFDPNQVADMV